MAYLVPTAHCAVGTKTLMLQARFAHPPMPHRNVFSKHSGVAVGLFSEKALQLFLQNARPSGSLRSPSDGRGKLRSPLHPSLLPPKNANGRAGGKRTRLGRKRNRARSRRRRYAAAQRTPARRSRARGLPVRGSQGQDGRPRGGPGEPQRPRFALPRLLRHSAYSPIFPAKFLFAEGMRRCCAKFSFLWISF